MPTEKIGYDDDLRDGTDKLNKAIDQANKAETDSVSAVNIANTKGDQAIDTANRAETKSDSVQEQFNQVVIEGDSSVEAAQARVDASGQTFDTLRDRLNSSDSQLAETMTDLKNKTNGQISLLDYQHLVTNNDWIPAFQESIKNVPSGGELLVPNGIFEIDAVTGISLKSNMTLRMTPNTIIKAKPTASGGYSLIRIYGLENVNLYFGQFIGERNEHLGTDDERGHGIRIQQSKNIYVHKPVVKDTWGDGIYIGKDYEAGDSHNNNVIIFEPDINNVRRNGISVCDGIGKGVTIVRPKITKVNGTQPQAGIDIEPEGVNTRLEYLKIIDPYTAECDGYGIFFHLANLVNRGLFTSIDIAGHQDTGSYGGLGYNTANGKLSGNVQITNPHYENNITNGIQIEENGLELPHIKITNPSVINCNRSGFSDVYGSAISIVRLNTSPNVFDFGNVTIEKPTIIDNRNTNLMKFGVYVVDLANTSRIIKRVNIYNPLEISGVTQKRMYFKAVGVVTDEQEQLVRDDTYFEQTISFADFCKTYTSNRQDATTTYTLGDGIIQGFPSIRLIAQAPQRIKVTPPTGKAIRPLGLAGESIRCEPVIGSSITLKPTSNGDWLIENMVGTWSVAP